jgi:tripartite-type tricarboxylate transporter receptor subunit TctC
MTNVNRFCDVTRRVLCGAALLIAAAAPLCAHAQWPERPIKLIVPYTAGGVVDTLGRLLGKHLEESLKTSVIVENVAGAGGTIGAASAARAAADGYTLFVGATGPISVAKVLFPALSYDPEKSFTPIGLIGIAPFVVATNKQTEWKTIDDAIAASKRKGAKLSYGSAGIGSPQHIIAEMFNRATGASFTHVPYRGSVQAIQDLIAGRTQLIFDNPLNLIPHIQSGKLIALAQTGMTRLPVLNDVPTLAEAGLNGFNATPWYGVLAPRGLSPAIAQRLNEEVSAFVKSPQIVQQLANLGISARSMTLPEMEVFLSKEGHKWTAAATAAVRPS